MKWMIPRLLPSAAFFLALSTAIASAADGALDPSFGAAGITTVAQGQGCTVSDVGLQSGGRLVAAGYIQAGGNVGRDGCLMRLDTNGRLDTTFGTQGIVQMDFGTKGDWLNSLIILEDDRILAAGFNGESGAQRSPVVIRCLEDGSPDPAFGVGGRRVVTQLAGQFGSTLLPAADGGFYLGTQAGYVMKFKADGSVDAGYGVNGVVSSGLTASSARGCYALGPDNTLFVGGTLRVGDDHRSALARLTPGGRLDTTFGNDGIVTYNASPDRYDSYDVVEYDPDTRTILVLGGINGGNATSYYKVFISRFRTDGQPDPQMGSGGTAVMDFGPISSLAHDFTRLPDGRLLICASYTEGGVSTCILARCLANGTPDPTFQGTGAARLSFGSNSQAPSVMLVQPDQKVVMAGYAYVGGAQNAAFLRVEHEPISSGGLHVLLNGARLYAGRSSLLDFGIVPSDDVPVTLGLTLKNMGGTSLTGISASITQGGSAFSTSQAAGLPWNLAAGESRNLDITFAGGGLGAHSGLLRIVSETEPGSPVEIPLGARLHTPGLPVIHVQPRSCVIQDTGSIRPIPFYQAVISVAASNSLSLPQTYQWYVDDVPVPDATGYQMFLTRDSQTGTYTVKISTSAGTITSKPASVAAVLHGPEVVTDTDGSKFLPAYQGNPASIPIDVRLPAGTRMEFAWVDSQGTPLNDGAHTGYATPTLGIKSAGFARNAWYYCFVTLKDAAGILLDSTSYNAKVKVLGPPQVFTSRAEFEMEPGGTYEITQETLGAEVWNRPTRYDISGLPPGIRVASTGPTSFAFTGTLASDAVPGESHPVVIGVFSPAGYNQLTILFVVKAPTTSGLYLGLASPAGLESTRPENNSAAIQFMTTQEGMVSGFCSQSGVRRAFQGPSAARGLPMTFSLPARSNLPEATLELMFHRSGTTGEGALYQGRGTSSEPSHSLLFDRSSFARWSPLKKAILPGRHNVVLDTWPPEQEASSLPQGHGFLSIVVSRSGMALWSGRLPDGQALLGSSPVLGQWVPKIHLYQSLYENAGSFGASLAWDEDFEQDGQKPVTGDGAWLRPARKNTPGREQGFITRMQMQGMAYDPPGKGRTYMNLRPAPPAGSNAELSIQLEDAGEILAPVRFTGPGSADMVLNGMRLMLSPSGSTGLIQGSLFFRQQDPVNPRKFHQRAGFIYGIAVPDPSMSVYGHLLIHALPERGKPARWISGAVRIMRSRPDD